MPKNKHKNLLERLRATENESEYACVSDMEYNDTRVSGYRHKTAKVRRVMEPKNPQSNIQDRVHAGARALVPTQEFQHLSECTGDACEHKVS